MLPLLALNELIQITHSADGLIQLDLDAQLILQIHQQLYRVQRIDSQFAKRAFGLDGGYFAAGAVLQ